MQNGNDPSIRENEFVVYYSWILYCGMCLGIHGYYIGEMTLSLFRTGITIISNERMSVGLLVDARTIELFIEVGIGEEVVCCDGGEDAISSRSSEVWMLK